MTGESPDGIIVLHGGLTIQCVALGLFEVTLTRPDGVWPDLMGMWDLQQMVDELARMDDR